MRNPDRIPVILDLLQRYVDVIERFWRSNEDQRCGQVLHQLYLFGGVGGTPIYLLEDHELELLLRDGLEETLPPATCPRCGEARVIGSHHFTPEGCPICYWESCSGLPPGAARIHQEEDSGLELFNHGLRALEMATSGKTEDPEFLASWGILLAELAVGTEGAFGVEAAIEKLQQALELEPRHPAATRHLRRLSALTKVERREG